MGRYDATTGALFIWMAVVFLFLYAPIAVVVIYSFNGGRNLYIWTEFSTFWYTAVFENPRVINALYISLQAAAINVVIAVSLGVMAGLTLARRKGRWTRPFLFLLLLVLFTPELVAAIGLLIWFNHIELNQGLLRLAIGHSLFNLALVTLVVRGRAEGIGESLEEAAADLGAPPWRAFVQITLPVLLPAVVAGALLAFTYSFDDVIISLFVQQPGSTTLPVHILSSFKPGLRGDVAAIVVMTLVVSLIGVGLAALLLRRSGQRELGF